MSQSTGNSFSAAFSALVGRFAPAQGQSAVMPTEKGLEMQHVEHSFEHAQLLAHRRWSHGELLGRRAHGAQPGDGIERAHGI